VSLGADRLRHPASADHHVEAEVREEGGSRDERALRELARTSEEHGERHEIRNTGRTFLTTLNFYYPPAYDQDEETLPAGEG
jgi:hypothetical protein